MKRKDLIKLLKFHGFYFLRSGGNHDVYTNGKTMVPVPKHNEINELLAGAIIRKLGKQQDD